jgi:hypothetical protein
MSVSCEYCVSSGTGLCDGPVNIQSVVLPETDREVSVMRRLWPTRGCTAMEKANGKFNQTQANECASPYFTKSSGQKINTLHAQ